MISKKEYEELKPYYDYQRKVAYNKEKIYEMPHKFNAVCLILSAVNPMLTLSTPIYRIPPEEYEEPPKDWVPKDEKYRIEGTFLLQKKSCCVPNSLLTNKLN